MRTVPRSSRVVWTIFVKEVRELLRDRRAVFFAFVLPLFLYPVLFLGVSTLPRSYERELREKDLVVGLSGADTPIREHVRDEDALALVRAEPDEEAIRVGDVHAFVAFEDGDDGALVAHVSYIASLPASREALVRLRGVLERLGDELLADRFAARGVELRPDSLVAVSAVDTSTAEERSALGLGRFLPTLLMLLLLTGGAFAAIDLVAGEKERGTLETLWVQAVSARQIVTAKFLVVLGSSAASVVLNLLGLLAAVLLGLAPEGFGGDAFVVPPAQRLFVVVGLLVPFAVLSSAILLLLSSYARSYREAQTYLLPLTLVILVPVALAAAPQVDLRSVLAVVPVANVALATREAVSGEFEWALFGVVFLSTCLYAGLALRQAAKLLSREDVLLGLEQPPLASDSGDEARGRRALAFGALSLLIVYFGAGWLQGGSRFGFVLGTVLTLWIVVLVPAVLYPLATRRPVLDALALRRPRWSAVLLAVPAGLATSFLAAGYLRVQEAFLPFPTELAEAFAELFAATELGWVGALFVFAISPGICEELLWRGAFQGDLEPRRRPWRTAIVVGVFFGVFHFSAWRFVPTAFVGAVLAGARHRGGSIWPCMLLHITHNASSLFLLGEVLQEDGSLDSVVGSPWVLAAAGAVLALALRGMAPRARG